jgi:hypothetical protein
VTSPLEWLAGPGKPLAVEPFDAREFEDLKRSGLTRLRDARNPANALESRFDLACSAARVLSLAALRRHGFRVHQPYVVFQVIPHTLGLGPDIWRVLDNCHQIRNLGEYESDLNIDERIVADLLAACTRVAEQLDTL